jgi:hypothetical protein
VDAGGVGDPGRVGQLQNVPQLVAEQREPHIDLRIEIERHTHVAKAADRRHELRDSSGVAGQMAAPHVDDQVRLCEAIEDGPEGRRVLATAKDGRAQARIIGAEERRSGGLGERGHGAGEQHAGRDERATRG